MYVKVCGITRPAEIDLLGALPVNLVGLWYGVAGGRADLSLAECQRLAATACATRNLEPVLVTFLNDAEALREVIHRVRLRWIQLHGYQTPGLVRAVKRAVPEEVRVIKVLHVQQEYCLEASLIQAYEKAGVDVFLFDSATDDGRIGSTGKPLDSKVVTVMAKRLTRPFLLAGGINSENWREHANVIRNPRWLGIDLDTNARGRDGRLRPENVSAIVQAWTACIDQGRQHV
ncbi:MAG: phosphoribosylanthranilate isomerase [Pseudonocardiaceae bacterium]